MRYIRKGGGVSSRVNPKKRVKMMFAKKLLVLAAVGALSVGTVFAKAAPRREKPPASDKIMVRIPLSVETKRLAAECRRDPSDEKREELKRMVRKDYDRYIAELRNKRKTKGHRRDQHRFNEMMINERDSRVDKIVDHLLNDPPEKEKKPRPPRKKR